MLLTNLSPNPRFSPILFPQPQFPNPNIKFPSPKPRRHIFNPSNLRSNFITSNPKPNLNFKVCSEIEDSSCGLVVNVDDLTETDGFILPVEISMCRMLEPALTLRHGVERLGEEIGKLKLDPPCSHSGVLRFQVAVPPSMKALDWFCCQQKSARVFPQIYFSGTESGISKVSGMGSAIKFCSYSLRRFNLMARYLSIDSHLIRAYGFIGISYDKTSSMVEQQPDSFYFVIPQIELIELENCSFLASTLVWDNTLAYAFREATKSLEKCLQQIVNYIPSVEINHRDFYSHGYAELNANDVKMVCLEAEVFALVGARDKCMQLEEFPTGYQSYFRHSPTVSFRANMFASPQGINFSIKECANINTVWASLIVEECVRLGFTYFCIAPGSRSSPLAISACRHPLLTCISCFDERSLAFHAVGYGRGSQKPAVVITSSGTAVSNLLPAVVEASQDFVPLVLLTADRPPELLDAGANQAIDQVNHFGKFVRFFFNLPPPTDQIPARMVLTTIDSAAYRSTQIPFGPVHINCPFRDPLEDHPKEWTSTCLNGLDLWMTKTEPFTKYIKFHSLTLCCEDSNEVAGVLQLIQNATKGLLVIGAIHTEDEIWSALLLTRHLYWPVVSDIMSGLRLRRVLSSFPEIEDRFLFIDHLDHALLSESVKNWAKPDVVVHIGSRITSKRMGQFLEFCSPHSYILVDKHPCRHDPSHVVTHRIQTSITEFADVLLKILVPRTPSKWSLFLQALNMMVALEISFLIRSEPSLTEPHVAYIIGETLDGDAALFLGNSMVIRDVDMYGKGWVKTTTNDIHFINNCNLQLKGIQVAGNRGASGIDGLLSTAIGFAAGSGKKIFCMIGDVSLLHDTNGLAVLNQRTRRKPVTVLVVNNHGGAIFSLLPIADSTPTSVLKQYFYTSHDVSVRELCSAHSVKHLLARTKNELQHALLKSQKAQEDCVIEVESDIAYNAKFHRTISKFACQAADQTLRVLEGFQLSEKSNAGLFPCKIQELKFSLYRIQLCAPLTSSHVENDLNRFYREGFILSIALDDGSVGVGEVAPIEIHREDLSDAEEQLRFLVHVMEGSEISFLLPLIKGSFSNWIWRSLGIPPCSIFPSVRCGIEMAILNAIAAKHASSLSNLMTGCSSCFQNTKADHDDTILRRSVGIPICALIDCNGAPKEVAHVVSQIVDEGFTTIKIKVARRESPIEDASVIQEIRQTVGYRINIRADANRKWTYEKAVQFGLCVKNCDLQYIEEPVCSEDDIVRFCEETSLPVALDETIDSLEGDVLDNLNKFVHPRIVAVVIKPSVVGGFENASFIAKWAQMHGKMVIISSAFESSLGLSVYIQFAHYLEQQNEEICKFQKREFVPAAAHGLGTYRWLKKDVTSDVLKICVPPHGDTVEASIKDADIFLRNFQIDHTISQWTYKGEKVRPFHLTIDNEEFSHSLKLLETGRDANNKVVIFLHGFLGSSEDWVPLMKAISATARCISIDLPGHGHSLIHWHSNKNTKKGYDASIESVADILMKVICTITTEGVILVGYSMGARIALYMALKYNEKINGAVIVSGSPGLRDEPARRIRTLQDIARARYLMSHGLECFLETWYAGEIWKSLRDHPHFKKIISNRVKHHDVQAVAKALSDLSVGRQLSLWEDLKQCKNPLLLVAGEKDAKFREISQQIYNEIRSSSEGDVGNHGENLCEVVIIKDCGHAVHLENPLPLINAVRKFVSRVNQ